MAETEAITVAETSEGVGGHGDPGRSVDLPVVELLTGRGFVTGKSGSGKSNTASVIAENLLDNGFGLLIVDIDGEYYGLKEEYEILHVGGDEECDIQVTVEHAEKIASLALEQNVPIILDISSFLDEEEAEDLLCEVAKQLFAKAKKQKQPFLMLVEECHEWIPEKGSVNEVGKMLIKIGKRGRKHGLGIVGISQRPADVKKDYITQCDWLVWHRLTWNNDTKVVGRIIDSEYADAVESLDDGEAFLMTDWAETIRRVQFHRKKTFDAGATPGLDDFERPELKSVSEDLVSELETISDEKEQTESRLRDLREELDKKNSRIAELETELQDARDMTRMAEQFTEALLDHVEGYNPGRTQKQKERTRQAQLRGTDADAASEDESERSASDDASAGGQSENDGATAEAESEDDPSPDNTSGGGFGDAFGSFAENGAALSGGTPAPEANGNGSAGATNGDGTAAAPAGNGTEAAGDGGSASADGPAVPEMDFEPTDFGDPDADDDDDAFAAAIAAAEEAQQSDGGTDDSNNEVQQNDDANSEVTGDGPSDDESPTATDSAADTGDDVPPIQPRYLLDLRSEVDDMDEKTRRMLEYYVEQGPDTPLNAHFSAGGSGDRTSAYAHNRHLRLDGFVEHVGRGRYAPRLRALVEERAPDDASDIELDSSTTKLRRAIDSR